MKTQLHNITVVFLILVPALLFGDAEEFNGRFISAARNAKGSVVNIIVYRTGENDRNRRFVKTAYGSGTIISDHGYLVTNHHVISKGDYYQIISYDGREYEAKLFRNGKHSLSDEKTDIAVMRIDDNDGKLRPLQFADSNALSEGEWVLAIGNPYGLRQSVTSGIVSSKGRSDIGFADIEDFIQTDVPINPGNSGGPLINLEGKLVGINTAIRTMSGGYQGISFAIPSNIVQRVARELISHGRVRRGWLGFIARERKVYSRGERCVVEVISVVRNSPAEAVGMKVNDIIRSINRKEIGSLGEMVKIISSKPVGSSLKISVSREGQLIPFNLVLREKDMYRSMRRQMNSLLTRYGIELDENADTGEVVVSYLLPMKKGYQNGLKRGDIIAALNGNAISGIEAFLTSYDRTQGEIRDMELKRNSVRFTVDFLEDLD